MAQTTSKAEQFWAQLDALGETEVRLKLATGFYGGYENQDRRPLVKEWLRRRDHERLEASNLAHRRSARNANTAAWVAAIAAIVAAICAVVTIIPAFSRLLPAL
jgi:hypothetical protein